MRTIRHLFMPGQTINAAIKKHNRHDVTSEELDLLMREFITLNSDAVPRVGQSKLIPILDRHSAA